MAVKSNMLGSQCGHGAHTVNVSHFSMDEVLPHAGRMILVDKMVAFDDNSLTAQLEIRKTSLFLQADDTRAHQSVPARVGIEYMAQTIAAWAGVQARLADTPVKIGYLLGSRHYKSLITSFPLGDQLTIKVDKTYEANDIGVFDCQILRQGKRVVTATLNVYQPE